MTEQPDDLLTPGEVCQKLGITQKHYVNGIQNTDTGLHWPRVKFSAKVVRYERRSIEAFIQKCRSQY